MDDATDPYLFRGPRSTPESRGGRPPEHRFENRPGMVVEKDIAVPYGSRDTSCTSTSTAPTATCRPRPW